MQLVDDRLLLSASDLVAFLECEHLSSLDLRVATGVEAIERVRDESTLLVARKGDEHERGYLERLLADHAEVAVISGDKDRLSDLSDQVERTAEAMRAGVRVVYQAALTDGAWRGYADFLERVPVPSALGDHSYEVVDTKLARRAKPAFLMQLCLYCDLLARIQERQPELMHVVLGTGERRSFRVAEFFAFYRRLRRRYEERLASGFAGTYPEPVEHCGLCGYIDHCCARWGADDHLSLIAGIGRAQVVRLGEAGIKTCTQLAVAVRADRPRRIGPGPFDRLRDQARLQVHERTTGEQLYELLEPEDGRGFARLPEPRPGDLFFDMEGDPFYEGEGLEYLFGVTRVEAGEPVFRAFWAHDRWEEKLAFEAFIDFVIAALDADPAMHVYHYAPYEPTALKRLMGRHGTREEEVDRLLREHVLVDLYGVTRQALRASKAGYSIKHIEAFYMADREGEVTDAGESIVRFEEWLDTGDPALLHSIEVYNEADCRSTVNLHEWLLERKAEAERSFDRSIPWRPTPEPYQPSEKAKEALDEAGRLHAELTAGLPDGPAETSDEERAKWLMAQLLHYHRREEKPAWWAYFARREMSDEELVDDPEAIGQLSPHPDPTVADGRSLIYMLRFPEQEHKLSPGGGIVDVASERAVNVVEIDDASGILQIRRGQKRHGEPLPTELMPGAPYNTSEQRAALRRVGCAIVEEGIDGAGRFRALRDALLRRPPRIAGAALGAPLQDGSPRVGQLQSLAERLEDSCLFIQGPPGSGKTWTGAQIALHLLDCGQRVGIAAGSHKAIHNLLHEIEDGAFKQGIEFRGWKKCAADNPESWFDSRQEHPWIANEPSQAAFPAPPEVQLVAGTAWLFAPEAMDGALDYLILDEAGQISLADALAIGTAASNLILLGDPLQLAQVSQGTHTGSAGCSVLEHLLGQHGTIPPERGIFLDRTRRMHPQVCRFVSEVVYENRLDALEECARQRVDSSGALGGAGVRFIPVDHAGNTRASVQEANAIAAAIDALVGAAVTECDETTRPLQMEDVMVVTPYNAQVRCLSERLLDGVRIGTVDKFQGQEAQVVFFSMATSSGAEVPRNVEFLYSRNRLNVAVSRARSLAVLVCNPELLHLNPRSVEQMRLVNALCRLVELDESTGG